MERNQITGLVLMALLMIAYFYFFPSEPPVETVDSGVDTTTVVVDNAITPDRIETAPVLDDSTKAAALVAQFGVFAPAADGEERTLTVTTDKLALDFNTLGGTLEKVTLNEFQTAYDQPLVLRDAKSTDESYYVQAGNLRIDLRELYYTTSASSQTLATEDTTEITFMANLGQGRSVKQVYTVAGDAYVIGHRWEFEGLGNYLQPTLLIDVKDNMRHQEEVVKTSRSKATVIYYTDEGDQDELSERSTSLEEETVAEPIKWVDIKQKFFSSVYIADDAFSQGSFTTSVPNENDTASVKLATLALTVPLDSALNHNKALSYRYYFGPNDYNILKNVEEGMRGIVYLGWPPVKWVNRFLIIPIFEFLELFIPSYGIIIIILVLIIKGMLSPLTYRSYKSMARMRVLKPETDKIKEKYPDDMQKQQQETMALYRQVGVNPISGCIPQLLQMPVLFAMFYFFPVSIELRQEAFLWAHDLSTYDTLISWSTPIPIWGATHLSLFTVLMTISTILYTRMNNQMSSVTGPMKTVTYIMPIFFLFFLNDFPAALTFYYFVSNLITFGQQGLIRRFIDEDKIKAILDENRLKNKDKKKSKFQARLEEAMKASEAAQKEKSQKRKQDGSNRQAPKKKR